MTLSRKEINKRSRARGRSFEARVANALASLGAYIYNGTDGDVATPEYIIECKYRTNWTLRTLTELADFLAQSKRNADAWKKRGKPRKPLIALTGGRKTGMYFLVDEKEFVRLWELAHRKEIHETGL